MTPTERRQAIQAIIGARLALEAASQQIKRCNVALGKVSYPTAAKVLTGREDYKLSSLFLVADSLEMDVEITLHKRSA